MKYIFMVAGAMMALLLYSKTNEKTMEKQEKKEHVIYFAGGCFWGTEHFFKLIEGVTATEVGYANGNIENPTYQQVCTGKTDFAETVKVCFDDEKVTLPFLLNLYFQTIDPTSVNQQGHDVGTQYRTGIFYVEERDKKVIEEEVKKLAAKYQRPLALEVLPLKNFFKAEEYHQDYLDKNPNGYCHLNPALFELAKKAKEKKL